MCFLCACAKANQITADDAIIPGSFCGWRDIWFLGSSSGKRSITDPLHD
jgi:hypothetical protein